MSFVFSDWFNTYIAEKRFDNNVTFSRKGYNPKYADISGNTIIQPTGNIATCSFTNLNIPRIVFAHKEEWICGIYTCPVFTPNPVLWIPKGKKESSDNHTLVLGGMLIIN